MGIILDFYRGVTPTPAGHRIEDIWEWSDDALERDHDYIQWLFPSNEASQVNDQAPVLGYAEHRAFLNDAELQDRVKSSLVRMLAFLGFELVDDDVPQIVPASPTLSRPDPFGWARSFNHNHLRVTRILKSLRLTGMERYALAFFDALKHRRHEINADSWYYWQLAMKDDLERSFST